MKVKRKYFSYDYLWFFSVITLLYLKLTFSYLLVEHSYWIRNLPTNFKTFNFFGIQKHFSTNIEYLLIPLLFIYILMNYRELGRLKTTFLLTFSLIFLNAITYFFYDVSFLKSIEYSLKVISPIYLFLGIIIFTNRNTADFKKTLVILFKYCIVLIIIGLLFFEISMNRKLVQLPIFFSNIHTHSYIIASIFIGISFLLGKNKSTLYLILFFAASFLFLFIGYTVRTASVLYLVFIIAVLYTRHSFFKYLWIQILVLAPLVLLAIFLIVDFKFDEFSSGRLTMYSDKFEILKSYSFKELLFGRGYGSDFITTEEWWWSEKGSHSDFITYIIENGALYLIAFLSLILSILPRFKNVNVVFLSIIGGYLSTSLISNGIAVRPLAGYIFFLVLAYIYNVVYRPLDQTKQ